MPQPSSDPCGQQGCALQLRQHASAIIGSLWATRVRTATTATCLSHHVGNKGAHCNYDNMPQPSSDPSKRRSIQTKATDQPILTVMFSSSPHSTTRCEQLPQHFQLSAVRNIMFSSSPHSTTRCEQLPQHFQLSAMRTIMLTTNSHLCPLQQLLMMMMMM